MKWFKHDANAHTDDKIQTILMKYGADGYALYWYCIELIAARVTPDNITFELKHDAEILGYHLKIDTLRVEEIMRKMCAIGLFEYSGVHITCLQLAKRLDNTTSQSAEVKETLNNFKSLKADKTRLDKNKNTNARFDAFYARFNYKVDGARAEKAWLKLTDKERDLAFSAVDAYVASTVVKGKASSGEKRMFRKYPATWLNGKNWEDDVQESGGQTGGFIEPFAI